MKLEVRYDRSFLLDLRDLEAADYQQIYQFVFEDFSRLSHLNGLPDLRQMGSSEIFYRFTYAGYLITIEVAGEIIKFLRVLPKPNV